MSQFAADIVSALQDSARAGASAVSGAGRDILGAFEILVIPHLRDVGIHVAEILEKRAAGIFSDDIAQTELASQCDAVKELIETVATLVAGEVQQVYDAIIGALGAAVNKAAGIALLAP
jgi:hypothetical protein